MTAQKDKKFKSTIETQAFLAGELTQVDVGRIEKELKELWNAAAASDEKDDGDQGKQRPSNVMRACSANVVLYSTDADAEVAGSDVLDEIAIQHPSRAILAISRKSQARRIEAWVSARCHVADARALKQICSEQITVRYEGEGTKELASVVAPLVIPDLPVLLWWRAGDLDRQHLEPFLRFIDRLVVDSRRAHDLPSFFNKLALLSAEFGAKPVVSDVAWGRLFPWRNSIANAFQDGGGPLTIASLKSISEVRICYAVKGDAGTDASASCEALLLAAWLGSRLQWKVIGVELDDNGGLLKFDDRGRAVTVRLLALPCDRVSRGTVFSVTLSVETPVAKSVTVEQKPGTPCLYVHPASEAGCKELNQSAESFSELGEAKLIDNELEFSKRDLVYAETLRLIDEIGKTISAARKGKKE
ncbi:MAG TPA: glucose-6-phosphate dehydrogenase assembly protein OpcA [Candidatus Obscuribacterales bacterium]